MNAQPENSGTFLDGGHESSAEAIESHAVAIVGQAGALLQLTRACNDDEITQVAEDIVTELAAICRLQGLELEEILPTETCIDCERPCLDFRRSKQNPKVVTCIACLDREAESTLEDKLRASLDDAREPKDEPRHSRSSVLDGARIATVARERHHGKPRKTFARIADLWSTILNVEIGVHHVALCLAALKIARACEDPAHGDNWVDLAGYAACGGEVAQARRSP